MLVPISGAWHTVDVYCISYQLLRKKLPPNLAVESNKHLLCHTVSMGQKSGRCLTGWVWLRVPPENVVRMLPGAEDSSEDLPGPGGSTSKVLHSHGWQGMLAVSRRPQFLAMWIFHKAA